MTLTWWALFLVGVAGVVLTAGSMTRFARGAAIAALVLFAVSAVFALVTVLD